MTSIEISEALDKGVKADIWYDAADYGDTSASDLISDTQDAMTYAARVLRESVPPSVTLLTITFEGGVNSFVCTSREVADERLYEYVSENWEEEVETLTGRMIPEDKAEAVQRYFGFMMPKEDYEIECMEVSTGPEK